MSSPRLFISAAITPVRCRSCKRLGQHDRAIPQLKAALEIDADGSLHYHTKSCGISDRYFAASVTSTT